MTDPNDSPPAPRDPRDVGHSPSVDEVDPTGVRAILSALPDPGPMPAELVHRINASLAAERPRHETGARTDARTDPGGGTLHALSTAREHRTSPGRRLSALAVAASMVVLAGAVLMGLFAMNGGLGAMGGSDTALESAVSDANPDQGGEAGAAELAPSSESDSPSAGTGEAGDEETMSMAAVSPPILATGIALTSATLAEHARSLRDDAPTLGQDVAAERSMVASPVGTPEGAAECLGGLLAITPEAAAGLVMAVDFVRFAGSPAVLILTGSPDPDSNPAGETEAHTAYLVPLDCGSRTAVPLHEPVRIDS
ncbi:MAG: hypothetical protein ABR500_02195 [Dermatophilaceae bacterium]|nr:hypothetical protein [Intrasporangiaceae bacterium]